MLKKNLINIILPNNTLRRKLIGSFIKKGIWFLKRLLCINFLVNWQIKNYAQNNIVKQKIIPKKISIIILSFNRFNDTKNAIQNIYKFTRVPFELIILDNNSNDRIRKKLKLLVNQYTNIKLLLEDCNLGCAGGRKKALQYASGEYILFFDNDILVTPNYLENLISRLEEDEKNVGTCCKVVFPNGKIQFNGGTMVIDDGFAIYDLVDWGLRYNSPNTLHHLNCEWIPGGATLWKRDFILQFSIDEGMKGSFEDNEVCLRIKKAGFNLVNAPDSIVIHNHIYFKNIFFKYREKKYFQGRYNKERTKDALIHFYRQHGLIFSLKYRGNPWEELFGIADKKQIMAFINDNINSSKPSETYITGGNNNIIQTEI